MNTQSTKADSTARKAPLAARTGNDRAGILRWASQMMAALLVFGAILFLSAGRLNWLAGWIYLVHNQETFSEAER